jgi:glycosyltransferase involved in cell wall biosynthesis
MIAREAHRPGSITVVIPAYNRAAVIGHTLQAIFQQTRPASEILVVDDGSADSTVETAEAEFAKFARQHSDADALPSFRVIRQKNAGPGPARNRGLREARGEFVHFFDSDDIPALNKHEIQVGALERTGADIAFGPWAKGRIREHGAWSGEHGAKSVEHGSEAKKKHYNFEPEDVVLQQNGLPEGDLVKELLVRWSIVPQTCLFRRSILDKAGEFPEDLIYTEDQELFLRCLLAGAKVVHTPETFTYYRSDNADKLTASSERIMMRFDNWARLLMRIRIDCLVNGVEPLRWFGFRLRCDSALRDLESAEAGYLVAAAQLRRYLDASWHPRFFYSVAGKLLQFRGGLQTRLHGHRWNASFRTGAMTEAQRKAFPGVLFVASS